MRKKRFLQMILPYVMILPSVMLLLVVVFYPILSSLQKSFQLENGDVGIENYLYFFTDQVQRNNMIYTLRIVIVTVLLDIIISYILAVYLRFSESRISKWIGTLYLLPRFIPGLVAVNGMITIIRDSGLINRITRLFGADIKLGLMYNESGIVLMNLWFNIPFATMLLVSAMSAIQPSIIEAARDVGADKIRILTQMIFPLTKKDVMVTATFLFMSNIGSFTTPYLMGSTSPEMLGVTLYKQFNNVHYEKAAALSAIIFIFSSLSASVYIYTNMKKQAWENEV